MTRGTCCLYVSDSEHMIEEVLGEKEKQRNTYYYSFLVHLSQSLRLYILKYTVY